MSVIEKTVRIESMRRLNEKVSLTFAIVESNLTSPKVPKPEDVIEHLPKTETEKVAKEIAKSFVTEIKRHGMVPTPSTAIQSYAPSVARFSLLLSREEYEKLGTPTVFDEFKLKLERKTA